jgi:uncharacterized protein YggE
MTKKRFILVACAMLFSSLQTFSQTKTEGEEKPYIELNGKAEQEVIPNEIYINIVIRERYANKEKQTIEIQEEKLKAALKEINIDLNNLSLSDANADYVKVKFRTKDVLTKKDYTLKVGTATAVGQVFQQLDKMEITDAYISKVSHTKLDSLRKEVRITAIKAAKNKADYLLAAIGEQTGKPLLITEVEFSQPANPVYRQSAVSYSNVRQLGDEDDKDSGGKAEIQFKKIKIECIMYVKFAIK